MQIRFLHRSFALQNFWTKSFPEALIILFDAAAKIAHKFNDHLMTISPPRMNMSYFLSWFQVLTDLSAHYLFS